MLITQNNQTIPHLYKVVAGSNSTQTEKTIAAVPNVQGSEPRVYSQNILPCFKGYRDYNEYDDKDLVELNYLADNARSNPNLQTDPEVMTPVLSQELKMLEQEVLNPEKHIGRLLHQGVINRPDPREVEKAAITGLSYQYFSLNKLGKDFDGNTCVDKLIGVIEDKKDNYALKTKRSAILSIKQTLKQKNLTTENQNKVFKTLLNTAFGKESPEDLKETALSILMTFSSVYPESPHTHKLKEKIIPRIISDKKTESKSAAVLMIANFGIDTPESQALLENTLYDRDHENVITALYAMGKVKNQDNLDNLSDFLACIKDNKGFDPLTEMALCSVAEYINSPKAKEAKDMLRYLSGKEGLIGDIAQDLLDREKVETEPDFYINRFVKQGKLRRDEVSTYKNTRDEMIETIGSESSIKEKNLIDRVMLPFNGILDELDLSGYKILKIGENSPVTPFHKPWIGERETNGSYSDAFVSAFRSSEMILMKAIDDFAHEFMHKVDTDFIRKDGQMSSKLRQLYNNAAESEETCTDFYAATSNYEYIAQGYSAYTSPTRPLKDMLDNMNYSNNGSITKSTLYRKDPGLYDFIEDAIGCAEKNNKPGSWFPWS